MTYVVLKGYLYNPIDCVKPAVAAEPGKVYRKDSSFLLLLYYYFSIIIILLYILSFLLLLYSISIFYSI